jgi:hypothetical protein
LRLSAKAWRAERGGRRTLQHHLRHTAFSGITAFDSRSFRIHVFKPSTADRTSLFFTRKAGRVFVTEAIDGFFTRADNAINVDFAKLNNEVIIEISTGSGGLHPTLTNHYFTINPRTNRAIPKNLFIGDDGPTNKITSALLMTDRKITNYRPTPLP